MAILDIKKYNDPILRARCEEVKEIDENIKKIIYDMEEMMIKNNGVGLAANQVGIKKRIIVVFDLDNSKTISLINPKILKKSREKEIGEEGCLSFPDVFLNIKRSRNVKIEGINIKGEKIIINAEGFLARVFQHEIDHINGILFFDRLPFLERIKFMFKKWP